MRLSVLLVVRALVTRNQGTGIIFCSRERPQWYLVAHHEEVLIEEEATYWRIAAELSINPLEVRNAMASYFPISHHLHSGASNAPDQEGEAGPALSIRNLMK